MIRPLILPHARTCRQLGEGIRQKTLWTLILFYEIYQFNFLITTKQEFQLEHGIVSVNSLTLIGSFASSLVLQILDHNKQRIEYLPTSVLTRVNCIYVYVIASLKRNVGYNKLLGQSSKVCREGTIFNLFFPYFFHPLPSVDCKTVTLFLRFQEGRASSKKKGLEPG